MEGDEICGKGRKVLLSAMSDERASLLAWFASPTTAVCMS